MTTGATSHLFAAPRAVPRLARAVSSTSSPVPSGMRALSHPRSVGADRPPFPATPVFEWEVHSQSPSRRRGWRPGAPEGVFHLLPKKDLKNDGSRIRTFTRHRGAAARPGSRPLAAGPPRTLCSMRARMRLFVRFAACAAAAWLGGTSSRTTHRGGGACSDAIREHGPVWMTARQNHRGRNGMARATRLAPSCRDGLMPKAPFGSFVWRSAAWRRS